MDAHFDVDVISGGSLIASLPAIQNPESLRPVVSRGGLAPWQIRKIRDYIEDGLERALPLEILANLVSLSQSYFCRAFRQRFGETPHSYIIRRRVERAKTIMLTTSESLSQIAFACGFVDQPHLCRCFRQVTGSTPGAWRRRYTADPQNPSWHGRNGQSRGTGALINA